jgi:hypothetical protein
MKVLFVSPGPDTAGLGIGMKRAFQANGIGARAIRMQDSPWHYPADITWDGSPETADEVRELWRDADVIHIFEHPRAAKWFPIEGKTVVVQHLGTAYRSNPQEVSEACRSVGAIECADMHDLIRIKPMPWLPDVVTPHDLEKTPHDGIVIAHAPTNREYKSTSVVIRAVEAVMQIHPNVRFSLIEGVSNRECIARKAACDIFVDELTLGYGLNALEVWQMGIPDVSGLADLETRALMRRDFDLPFLDATADTLGGILEWLIAEPARIRHWGEVGRAHLKRFHSQRAVTERAVKLYEGTLR